MSDRLDEIRARLDDFDHLVAADARKSLPTKGAMQEHLGLAMRDVIYLLAEVERLTEHLARDLSTALEADGRTGTLTGNLAVDMAAYATRLEARASAAEAEVATLRATVERVKALAEGPASDGYLPYAIALPDGVHLAVMLDDLRAALRNEP